MMNTNVHTAVVKEEHDDETDYNDSDKVRNISAGATTTKATVTNTLNGSKNLEKNCADNEIPSKTAKSTKTATTVRTPITTSVKVLKIPLRSVQVDLNEKEVPREEDETTASVSIKIESPDEGDDCIIEELEEKQISEDVEQILPSSSSSSSPLLSGHQQRATHTYNTTIIPAKITPILSTRPTTNVLETTNLQLPRLASASKRSLSFPPKISVSAVTSPSLLTMARQPAKATTTTTAVIPQISQYSQKEAINFNIRKRLEIQNNRNALTKMRILERPTLPSLNVSSSAATSLTRSSIPSLQSSLAQLNQTATATNRTAIITTTTTTTTDGLRVKCPCELGSNSANNAAVNKADLEKLKMFFEQMFDETRRLSRQNQREVKMILLEAVSEAESNFEAGRNCKKCCG